MLGDQLGIEGALPLQAETRLSQPVYDSLNAGPLSLKQWPLTLSCTHHILGITRLRKCTAA